ncbi:MAG TPA: hypothetical protein VHG93_13210, partial [Longimicrobium sp.]|nr:hypothetical protein [Longimicrobium sp.]HEX2208638.1 hypothetical protein [Longimicrobium sp.]
HLRGDGRTRQEVLLDDLLETVPAAARPALRREFARLLSTAATRPDAVSTEAVDSVPAPQIVYIDLRSSS